MNDDKPGRGRPIKVARLTTEYGLEDIGEKMSQRWTAEEDRWSLRELADYFNQAILRSALEEEGEQLLDGEIENIYRLLTDSDVSQGDRNRVQRRLERAGLNVADVLEDFVSYQAIRTYLTEHQGAEYTPSGTDPLERESENINQLRGRVDSVTRGKLEQLRTSGDLTIGEFRTLVDVRVVCEDCNNQYDIVELLEDGGCECAR